MLKTFSPFYIEIKVLESKRNVLPLVQRDFCDDNTTDRKSQYSLRINTIKILSKFNCSLARTHMR
ncbi:hypothetical protein ES704_03009 [subsurface metagenome]|jgi:hypothetical protein